MCGTRMSEASPGRVKNLHRCIIETCACENRSEILGPGLDVTCLVRTLHLDAAYEQIVGPLIGETVLSEHRRDLTPVTDVVKEDVRCDLVLAG
jgi:hypothetical protein